MNTMETKFNTFLTALNQCPYELPEEIHPFLKQALKTAGFFDASQNTHTTTNAHSTTAPKTKKLSGYNIFMKEKMAELKVQNVPSGQRMTQVSQMWKPLSEEDKAVWKAKANALLPLTETQINQKKDPNAPKTKKLSGYNLFMKEKMAELKTQNVPSGQRMTQVSQMWKLVSEEEKATWKGQAAAL